MRLGRPDLARAALRAAVARDPDNWDYHYGLALVLGATGGDPRPEARAALTRNPFESRAVSLVKRLRGTKRSQWARIARTQPLPLPAPTRQAPGRR